MKYTENFISEFRNLTESFNENLLLQPLNKSRPLSEEKKFYDHTWYERNPPSNGNNR